jgi:hypothetical protein
MTGNQYRLPSLRLLSEKEDCISKQIWLLPATISVEKQQQITCGYISATIHLHCPSFSARYYDYFVFAPC